MSNIVPKESRPLVGLIGAGIQRSLSPTLHEAEARAQGLALHYQLIDLDAAGTDAQALPGLITAARQMGFAGLNITFPCKQLVLPLLDELSDEARAMGAVNTVVFRAGRAIGHNTDGSGWAWGFARALPGADLSRVVLLGTGGAGSAIAHAVLRAGARQLRLVDADPARARELAAALNALYGADRALAVADIAPALQGDAASGTGPATGLIHATPTGMDKLPGLPLPAALLQPGLWVSEVVYFPLDTALLKAARAAGCRVVDGGTMAVGQAVGAFELFTGLTPDAERMERHFRQLVGGTATA
ncbi:shikimate dehydrogenase [Aquabacterium sp. OR-4]|uniref:shikimate dehydrogenase n=1 Tax=Aquabacterium sp. OR-4 TaxID=2978127 RepID=UPI0021B4BCB3|nr:shikimate dehydrogenase [Aquabacterium sp. OR-4]MDT7838383.1 shikimate dehydrogenase [Aquabacterium sp. OR-4]